MGAETKVIRCSGHKNNNSRCGREKEVSMNFNGEWYCWQHEYQRYEHGFRLAHNVNYKLDGRMKHLAKQILEKKRDLWQVRDAIGIENIGFVRCFLKKKSRGKVTYADCRKVTGPYAAMIPYKFIITFYDYNTSLLSVNQQKILMYHELKHIGPNGYIVPHDIEDFSDILQKYGIDWASEGVEVPDILSEEVV
ncbi:putative metallopeptidase [Orenia marismortui]|uniref:putative metallopeptidase n=1 Tax=Orenia marismortui TaxID=46469 RepID=UPI0003637721|nr:putative metallopeptidase [Orenia marismortui]